MAMDPSDDELAGVVDLFGALTPAELEDALAELAFRRGTEPPDDVAASVERAEATYALVAYDPGDDPDAAGPDAAGAPLLVPGPAAFPTLPEGAVDLPHILDVEQRRVDRAAVGRAVEERFRADVARAVANGDDERVRTLLDVSYDLEAWAPVELDGLRSRLDEALAE